MIIIGILFGCIIYSEWRYLQLKNRKRSTFRYVLGTAVFLFLGFEALFYFREQWTIGDAIHTVFAPIEKIILMQK
ncbi:hypothetical protein OB236_31280 [Paenibacillus sp. WQ 127069]|uniref:DUF4181 domain-containing protein n=1 Tax=Paenibacillus baimaensis TaxID=2982185 RepID=A0ABT2US37_9BACL|nr:hypothetical protein [Paenibacillus sp. WQ 127069]MCU6796617.1 hypothetical protein [Paenibacillus sp. WQ 127069]